MARNRLSVHGAHETRQDRGGWIRLCPNLLSFARLALAAPVAILVLQQDARFAFAALLLCAIAAWTDFADGAIARAFRITSAWGGALDASADKIFVLATLGALAASGDLGPLPLAAFAITAARELAVGALRLMRLGQRRATGTARLAKLKTALQFAALMLLLASAAFAGVGALALCGAIVLFLSAALGLASALAYFRSWCADP